MRDITDPGFFRLSCGKERDSRVAAPALPLQEGNPGQTPGHRETGQACSRQRPAHTLAPSQLPKYQRIGTNPHAARAQFRWLEPSPDHTTTTKLPPAACHGVHWYPNRGGFAQKAGVCCGTGPSQGIPALTFLAASGSALLGALASKKLRLLATPSEVTTRLF